MTGSKNNPSVRRTRAAYHEAGHAVAALFLEVPISEATLPPAVEVEVDRPHGKIRAGGLNVVKLRRDPTPQQAFNEACFLVAGIVAEAIWLSKQPGVASSRDLVWLMIGGHDDLVLAIERIRRVSSHPDHVGDALMGTVENLEAVWDRVQQVAAVLLDRGRIDAQELASIGWPDGSLQPR